MKTNMGIIDRLIRLIVAITLAGLYLTDILTGTIGAVALIIAGIFLLTSLVAICPLYSLVGINTCPKPKQGKQNTEYHAE